MNPMTRYPKDFLADWTKQKLAAIRADVRRSSRAITPPRSFEGTAKVASFDAILAGCSWAEEISSNPHMPEPHWKALADILAHCEDGERIFHEISALDPRYDPAETAEKFARAKENAKPRTCDNICNELRHDGCQGCVFRDNDQMASPYKLGFQDADVVSLLRNYVLESDTNRYLELFSGAYVGERSFNNAYRHLIEKGTPHNVVSGHELLKKVAVTAYRPGDSRRFLKLENNRLAVNAWTAPGIIPRSGGANTIIAHLEKMLPAETVRNHFLDCLAFMVQKPGQKIAHAIVLIGRQGIGKSLFFKLVRKLFGEANCRTAESSHLGRQFNARMSNIQVLMIEELWTEERRGTYNGVKMLITEREIPVEEKHVPMYVARTPDLILATSNHRIPITKEKDDRRLLVYETPMEPQGAEYYQELALAIDNTADEFLHVLLARDISDFDPNRAPPETATGQEIIEASRTMIEQEIASMMEAAEIPFWRDLVNGNEIREAIYAKIHKMPSQNEVTAALKNIGAAPVGNVRMANGSSPRLWAWRNIDRWLAATPDEKRNHICNPRPRND